MIAIKIVKHRILASALLIVCLAHCAAFADVGVSVARMGIYAGYLERFSDSKGIRWSDNIAYKVFADKGLNISVTEFPAKRLALSLETGKIDTFVSSNESLGSYADSFLRAKFPVAITTWYIYYDHTKGWVPAWPPDPIFKGKIGESQQSAESLTRLYQLNITQAAGFDAIVNMVNLGRADYWLESRVGLRLLSPNLLKTTAEGFTSRPLFRRGIYMFFQNTERGRWFKKVYDEGFEKILADGLYVKTYYKNDPDSKDTFTTNETIQFIRTAFPDFYVPEQNPL